VVGGNASKMENDMKSNEPEKEAAPLIWNIGTKQEEEKAIVPVEKKLTTREEKKALMKIQRDLKATPGADLTKIKRAPNDTSAIVGYDMMPNNPLLEQALREAEWDALEKEFTAIELDCTTTWGAMAKGNKSAPWLRDPKTLSTEEKRMNRHLNLAEIRAPHRNFRTGEEGRTIALLPVVSGYDDTIIPGPPLWSHVMNYYTREAEKLEGDLIDAHKKDAELAQKFINMQTAYKSHFDKQIKGAFAKEAKVEAY
jgi:hypothetical protein